MSIEIQFVPGGKHCATITGTGIWWCYGTECYVVPELYGRCTVWVECGRWYM